MSEKELKDTLDSCEQRLVEECRGYLEQIRQAQYLLHKDPACLGMGLVSCVRHVLKELKECRDELEQCKEKLRKLDK